MRSGKQPRNLLAFADGSWAGGDASGGSHVGDSYAVPCMEEKIDSLVLKLGGVVPPEPTE